MITIALLIFLVTLIVSDQVVKFLSNKIKEFQSIKFSFLVVISLYLSLLYLDITKYNKFFIIVLGIQAILFLQVFLERIIKIYVDGEENKIALMNSVMRFLIWIFGGLFILSNIGIDITSVMAGLGIGGIAFAFAIQNILSDLFSSFAIYLDKPFEIGDFIVLGEHMGIVEKIGIKTTRIRSLQGEEIVIANRELTSARIQNFKKMKKRRSLFTVSVGYNTTTQQIEKINQGIEKIITSKNEVEFDRVHFIKFNDFSLDFEVSYYVLSGDFVKFLDIQQDILIDIKKMFEKEKIEIPFPTQTLHIKK
jgi:small-conductance mechanosensitive channel